MLIPRYRSWWLTLLLVAGAGQIGTARADSTQVPDTLEQRIAPCTVCHGKQGEGVEKTGYYFPRIGGKPAGYLFRQLVNFREKRRQYVEMNYIVAYLPDAYLREIAEYFANQRPALPEPTVPKGSKQGLLRAETLITKGDAVERHPRLHGVSRQGAHRHRAGHSGPRRLACVLHRRPARFLEERSSTRQRARLHGQDRVTLERRRGRVAGCLAGISARIRGSAAAPAPARSAKLPLDCGDLK